MSTAHPPQQPPPQPPLTRTVGAVGAAPGTPYHLLARTERHRWWRPLLASLLLVTVWLVGLLVVLLGFVAAALAAGMTMFSGARLFGQPVMNVAALLAIVLVAGPAVLLAAWTVQRRPAGTVSSVTGRLRWRWLAPCFGLALATVIVSLGVLYILPLPGGGGIAPQPAAQWVGWERFLIAAAVLVALVPLQSGAEEYVFRGWVTQAVGTYIPVAWIAILPGAVLFALAHGIGTFWGFVDLLLFALIAGWLTIRTGGLEAGIALHTANNLVAFLLSAAFGSLGTVQTAAQASWPLFAIDVVLLPLYAWLIARLAARRNLARTVPASPDEDASPERPRGLPPWQ